MRNNMFDCQRSWLEIDLSALRHNVKEICTMLSCPEQFMAVVKADAYGHGAVRISKELNRMGIHHFAVATLAEAIELRDSHIKGDILILGYTDPCHVKELRDYDLTQTVICEDYAKLLEKQKIDVKVHVAIDTGMHRLGESDIKKVKAIYQSHYLHVTGLFSHLCVCDEPTKESQKYTYQQIEEFMTFIQNLKKEHYSIGKVHLLSSYGLLNYSTYSFDYVRMGILLYGVDSSLPKQSQLSLKPVLSLKSKIILVRDIQSGDSIGYGRTFITSKPMKIATVPIGYADGLPRALSNRGKVIVRGQFAPIVGRICMDQMMIDVTDVENIQENDVVTIIGKNQVCQNVETIAMQTNTISNEILSRIGYRLPKIYKYE